MHSLFGRTLPQRCGRTLYSLFILYILDNCSRACYEKTTIESAIFILEETRTPFRRIRLSHAHFIKVIHFNFLHKSHWFMSTHYLNNDSSQSKNEKVTAICSRVVMLYPSTCRLNNNLTDRFCFSSFVEEKIRN